MKKLSRREFVKSVAAGAIGLSALPILSACSTTEKTSETTPETNPETTPETIPEATAAVEWDHETDIVVVGTGTAIIAALAAADKGARVIVLEKDENMFGGTSVTSGGGYALPGFLTDFQEENNGDSRETCLSYMKAVGEGRMEEGPMVSFVDTAEEFCRWVTGLMGWSKFGHVSNAHGSYYEEYPNGNILGRGAAYPFDKEGNMLMASPQWQAFREYVDSHDAITLMMGTAGEELITDEAGAVIGIYAAQAGKRIAIKAGKGVILGTGGFDFNEKMRKQYLPTPIFRSVASRNNTGDSQRMGAKIGGQLAMMDRVMGLPFSLNTAEWKDEDATDYSILEQTPMNGDYCQFLNLPYSVLVNRKGRRFGNETREYDVTARSFGGYDTGAMGYENIPGFFICDSQYASRFLLPGYAAAAGELPDYIFKFDSLEDLADGMGIDKEGLLTEMTRFNENARNGVDPDWHRGESQDAYDTFLFNSSLVLPGVDISEFDSMGSLLKPVEQGPFYCVRYVPGSMNTRGGLQVDGDAQVVNQDGEKIPGLYAVGCCSTGVAGYWAGGACISQGCVMAYVAVKAALEK